MANHKSAVKRARGNEKKRIHNRQYLSTVRSAVKRFRTALESFANGQLKDQAQLKTLFCEAQSLLARAAARGIIHSKNASRKIQRLSQAAKKASTTSTETVVPVKAKASKAKAPAAKAKSKAAPKKKSKK